MWRKSILFSLVTLLAFSFAFADVGRAIGEDNSSAVIQKNRLDMANVYSLLQEDASIRNDDAVLNLRYDYVYAVPDLALPSGSLAETIVFVADVATVGTVTIDYDWDTDSYPSEGSFKLTSPAGTLVTIGAGQVDGHYTVALTGFTGEDLAGTWVFSVNDSYGDGGHALSGATMNVDVAAATPAIGFSSSALNFGTLPVGLFTTKTLSINNLGGGALTVSSIAADDGNFFLGDVSASVPAFGSVNITVGYEPSVAGAHTANLVFTSDDAGSPDTVLLSGTAITPITTGGPDVAGYSWVSSLDGAGPAYAWIDTVGATEANIAFGDDIRGTINLPFNFRYYGNVYSQITATTNGWVGMGPSTAFASSYWTNTTIPSSTLPNNMIAPLWDDFKAGDSPGSTSSAHGTIKYKTLGTTPNRQFVVIFDEIVRSTSDTDYFSFEVILDETTGDIKLQYLDVIGNGSANNGIGATVGIENAAATDGLLYGYNGVPQLVYNEMAIKFIAPPGPSDAGIALNPTAINFGVVPNGMSASFDVTILNDGGADLVITDATVAAPFSCSFSGTIPALQAETATVYYDPTTAGAAAETLTFNISGTYTGTATMALTGSSYDILTVLDEGFEGGTFPPANWSVTTTDASGDAWEAANNGTTHGPGSVAEGSLAAMADIYNMSSGTRSHLYSPVVDLSGMANPKLDFWWQCMSGSAPQPSLTVNMSNDGGATWSEIYYQEADGAANAWVNVNLFASGATALTMFDFVAFSDYGSYNMFLDAVTVVDAPLATPFFSEYMEGTSNNKGFEIYNLTGTTLDLDEYQIAMSYNGDGWSSFHSFPAGATLEHGDVWLAVADGMFLEVQALADEILAYDVNDKVVFFTGDDARALIHIVGTDTTFMDIIGVPTVDPGNGWDVAGVTVATQNHNLVRKPEVETGNLDWATSAGTSAEDSEWIVHPENFWYGMGYHNEPYPLPGDACDMPLVYGDVNDPEAAGTIESYGAVWYSFTNDGTYDNVTVSLCGSSFDTQIEVWQDCEASAIAYNDDACGVQSEVDLGELAAGDYLVKVFGYGSGSGAFTLNVIGTNGVPDFEVTSLEYYGQDSLDIVITNIGDGDSPGYFGTDYHGLYLNGDYLGYIAETDVALLAGEFHTYTLVGLNYDNLGAGMQEVLVVADVDNDVIEFDETNNRDSLMFEVLVPPAAPRHLMAMAGEQEVRLTWDSAPEEYNMVPERFIAGLQDRKVKHIVEDELVLQKWAAINSQNFNLRETGDDCSDPFIVASLPFNETSSTAGFANNFTYGSGNDVVYQVTITEAGFLFANTCAGTLGDTKMEIYAADCVTRLAYNDDACSLRSEVMTAVTPGNYLVVVDAYSVGDVAYTLDIFFSTELDAPDLAVTDMWVSADTVFAEVSNLGTMDHTSTSTTSQWYINDEYVGYVYPRALEVGGHDTLAISGLTWFNLGPGDFAVRLFVDAYNYVEESDETNNEDSVTVTITDPDYIPAYNVYRDGALVVANLEPVDRLFHGGYVDMDVVGDTDYDYYVTQIMPDLSESDSSNHASATPWAPVFYSFPFTEDFEAMEGHLFPFGYVIEEIGEPNGGNWEIGDSAYFQTNAYNGWHPAGSTGQFAGIDDDGILSSNGNEILWTPWVDLSTATNPQILFNYTVRGGNGGEFIVFDGENAVAHPLPESPMEWTGMLMNLGEYAGSTIRFGFHYDDGGFWAYGMGVDNITVEEAPDAGTISGMITDAGGTGIGFADVHVMGLFDDVGVLTDASGAYSVTVPGGDYQVDVMRVNYLPVSVMTSVASGGTTTLDFVLDFYLPAPEQLTAYPVMADTTIALEWMPPLPMGQVAYDDGSYEGLYWVSNPSTTNDYFAAHFKAAITPGFSLNEIAILATADDEETAFETVLVTGSDAMGGPDFSNVLWTSAGNNVAMYPGIAWDFYSVAANPATQDFWVVVQYSAGTTGPYIATDQDTFVGNCIAASTVDGEGNPVWGSFPYTLAIRAFLAEPSTGRSIVLHGSETTTIEKVGAPIAASVKQDIVSSGSFEAPRMTSATRELLNYKVYRSMDPMDLGEAYAIVAGESFNDADFDFDMQYFYAVSAVYDIGESGMSNMADFTFWSPMYVNHYEDFAYANGTPLAGIGWVAVDAAGNVAPNWNIENEQLHFDWSPTALNFSQTVTSPVANFGGATAARISFYLYLDDYNDSDNGTLNISATMSNDGFTTETVLYAHNDAVFGDVDEFMVFNISNAVAGTDGWQLRFTVQGATSFTMDNLWIDDIMVESDQYMGPVAFELLSPANNDMVEITSANVSTGALLFAWESAGDDMVYGIELTGTLGTVLIPFDTSATEVLIPYSALSAAFDFAGVTGVQGSWNIVAYYGMEMLPSSNGPFTLTIGTTVGTDNAFIPDVYALYQNYPNPFNPVTTITYDIPEASDVRLVVYNLVGQPVRVLVNSYQNPSRYTLAWNGLSDSGLPVSSGIYIYRLESESFVKTMKMMYLK